VSLAILMLAIHAAPGSRTSQAPSGPQTEKRPTLLAGIPRRPRTTRSQTIRDTRVSYVGWVVPAARRIVFFVRTLSPPGSPTIGHQSQRGSTDSRRVHAWL